MSDRGRARILAAGTSTFLSVVVAMAVLLSVGVLAGRLSAPPPIPGGTTVTIALPALSDTVTPPPTGPGAIDAADPSEAGGSGGDGGAAPGGPGRGENPVDGPGEPAGRPIAGARVSGDVGGLGLAEADVPLSIGESSGETTTTNVDVLGLRVSIETSEQVVEDLLCHVLCP